MTDKQPAGDKTPRTKIRRSGPQQGGRGQGGSGQGGSGQGGLQEGGGQQDGRRGRGGLAAEASAGLESAEPVPGDAVPRIRIGSVAGFLAIVPHLLGFHPTQSMVIVGLDSRRGRIRFAFRYDLPDPPDAAGSEEIAQHAIGVLTDRRVTTAMAAGYAAGRLVTPVVDSLTAAMRKARITLRDVLRVDQGRYWSYVCQDPRCCPPDGVPFDGPAHPAAAALAAAGVIARRDRAALADCLAPVTGGEAESMRQATDGALRRSEQLIASADRRPDGLQQVIDAGRAAVRAAIGTYRDGGQVTGHDQLAWLAVSLADLRVRDDAWARMDPRYRAAHRRLWTDVARHASKPYVPAPASLLAFTAWQSGDGALANIAIERALAADPGYSMAHLLGQALDAGLPPSAARLPMTPEEVEASYAVTERAGGRRDPATGSASGRAASGRADGREASGRAASGRADGRAASGRAARRPASKRPWG